MVKNIDLKFFKKAILGLIKRWVYLFLAISLYIDIVRLFSPFKTIYYILEI